MKEHQIMDLFQEIEQQYPVTSWKINDIDMWPVFRIISAFNLIKAKGNSNVDALKLQKNPKEISTLTSLLSTSEQKDFLFFSDSIYRVNLNGTWYNRLSDPFYEAVIQKGYKAINLDFSFLNAGKFPIIGDTYSLQNQLLMKDKVITNHCNKIHLPQFEDVRKKLTKMSQSDDILTDNVLVYIANEIIYWKSIFQEVIKKCEIKYVFIVNYYQVISQALIFACRELNIPTIDIQHGNQRDVFYHKWSMPASGSYNTLPNYYWVWSAEHAQPIKKWTSESKLYDVLIGGNLWLETWKDNLTETIKQYDLTVDKLVDKEQINILVTIQSKYGLPNWDLNIPESLIEYIKEAPKNYKFYIRYHQQMLFKYRDEMFECEKQLSELIKIGKVETQKATSLPLPALMKKMDAHITPFSTCVFEAKEFNVPSITLHPRAKLYFTDEINTGWVIEAETKEDISEAMHVQLELKKKLVVNAEQNDNSLFDIAINKIVAENYNQNYTVASSDKEVLLSIYYMDEEYNKVIELYEENDSYKAALYVSYTYKKLNDDMNELKYMNVALEKALGNHKQFEDMVSICGILNKCIGNTNLQDEINDLIRLLNQNVRLLGRTLWVLFSQQNYTTILNVCSRLNRQTLDSLYYAGRAFSNSQKYSEALQKLTDYVNAYENENADNVTSSKNFIISAYFYIGKIQMDLKNREAAVESFKKCLEISEGNHLKAKEFLDKVVKI